ncbi:hypothetical protein [Plantibacter sp. RU18]|uniref:hypothetical protein n=1 Tax=Plantibacter sp. RU18 TaxID=3158143 RepID=UPI002BD2A90C|nr:hypothetical protein [Gemmatimonadaceae bacterium]
MPEWIPEALLALIAAACTWIVARTASLERRIHAVERRERSLWLYCRTLIDHIYRGRGAPPPPPPAGLFKEDT